VLTWDTPNTAGGQTVCRVLIIPIELEVSVNGALEELADELSWTQVGTMTREEAADLSRAMLELYYTSDGDGCP